jgi:tryptophanyl-tRNA synthetase
MVSSHALFAYPVLMAADILIVNADLVPVGRDQKQHLEMTRDIAQKFNHRFGEVFKIPEAQIREDVAVVPGIDGEKMSKSYDNTIEIFGDSAGKTRKRIMSVVTDSKQLEDPKDPDTCNVFALYKLFANEAQVQEMRDNYAAGGYGYGHAKKALAELFEAHFAPMRAKREELQNNLDYVEEVLRKGAERAREETGKVMGAAREAKGLA